MSEETLLPLKNDFSNQNSSLDDVKTYKIFIASPAFWNRISEKCNTFIYVEEPTNGLVLSSRTPLLISSIKIWKNQADCLLHPQILCIKFFKSEQEMKSGECPIAIYNFPLSEIEKLNDSQRIPMLQENADCSKSYDQIVKAHQQSIQSSVRNVDKLMIKATLLDQKNQTGAKEFREGSYSVIGKKKAEHSEFARNNASASRTDVNFQLYHPQIASKSDIDQPFKGKNLELSENQSHWRPLRGSNFEEMKYPSNLEVVAEDSVSCFDNNSIGPDGDSNISHKMLHNPRLPSHLFYENYYDMRNLKRTNQERSDMNSVILPSHRRYSDFHVTSARSELGWVPEEREFFMKGNKNWFQNVNNMQRNCLGSFGPDYKANQKIARYIRRRNELQEINLAKMALMCFRYNVLVKQSERAHQGQNKRSLTAYFRFQNVLQRIKGQLELRKLFKIALASKIKTVELLLNLKQEQSDKTQHFSSYSKVTNSYEKKNGQGCRVINVPLQINEKNTTLSDTDNGSSVNPMTLQSTGSYSNATPNTMNKKKWEFDEKKIQELKELYDSTVHFDELSAVMKIPEGKELTAEASAAREEHCILLQKNRDLFKEKTNMAAFIEEQSSKIRYLESVQKSLEMHIHSKQNTHGRRAQPDSASHDYHTQIPNSMAWPNDMAYGHYSVNRVSSNSQLSSSPFKPPNIFKSSAVSRPNRSTRNN